MNAELIIRAGELFLMFVGFIAGLIAYKLEDLKSRYEKYV